MTCLQSDCIAQSMRALCFPLLINCGLLQLIRCLNSRCLNGIYAAHTLCFAKVALYSPSRLMDLGCSQSLPAQSRLCAGRKSNRNQSFQLEPVAHARNSTKASTSSFISLSVFVSQQVKPFSVTGTLSHSLQVLLGDKWAYEWPGLHPFFPLGLARLP